MIPTDARVLRLYLNASDRWHGKALYRAIVETARAGHGAGASVFPVELGYGTHHRLRDAQSEYTSFDVPVVIELVDAPGRVEVLLTELAAMIGEGLATVGPARVVRHASDGERAAGLTVDPDVGPERAGSEATMPIEGKAHRVTVYVGSSDTWQGKNLALAIVERCRAMGIAGATATRGLMGFGRHSVIHRAHLLGLSDDLPERIEIIDRPEQVARLLPVLEAMIGGGLIVVEDVRVIENRHGPRSPRS